MKAWRKWTDAEDKVIGEMYADHTMLEVAQRLGRSLVSVRGRCEHLDLPRKAVPWTGDDDEKLRGLYPTHGSIEIANILGRSKGGVDARCHYIGLNTKMRDWSEDELRQIRQAYEGAGEFRSIGRNDLALKLNRDGASISDQARKMGLTRKGRKLTATDRARLLEGINKWWKGMTKEQIEERSVKGNHTKLERYGTAGPIIPLENKPKGRWNGGTREDLGIYVRSSWEANYCRYLNFLQAQGNVASWQYESEVFRFEGVKRGPYTYTPDFKVVYPDGLIEYHEVKGWMDSRSRNKLARMAKFHPGVIIRVVAKAEYQAIAQWAALIAGWE